MPILLIKIMAPILKTNMKKINSLNELQNFFEQLGAKKEKGQGFVSWTLDSKDFKMVHTDLTNIKVKNEKN